MEAVGVRRGEGGRGEGLGGFPMVGLGQGGQACFKVRQETVLRDMDPESQIGRAACKAQG